MRPALQYYIGSFDGDVLAWRNAVIANGGFVSSPRLAIISAFVRAEKASGAWAKLDDAWLLVAENETQALVSLKQRRLATAVNAPTFTADAGYAFNGTTQYINTGFIPATHAVAMTGSDMRAAAYERANVASQGSNIGVLDGTDINIRLRGRSTSDTIAGSLSGALVGGSAVLDSRGYSAVSRSGSADLSFYRNGAAHGTATPGTSTTTLPGREAYIGCNNNAGVAAGFRAATIGYAALGASLTAAQELAEYNALQSFMTAANGAQV